MVIQPAEESNQAVRSETEYETKLRQAGEAVQQYAEAHPHDSRLHRLLTSYGETTPKNRPFLEALAAYATMTDDHRNKLLEWIALTIAPATRTWPASSYSIKYDFERLTRIYINNEEFKGAMLIAGHRPAADSAYHLNWDFKIKPTVPAKRRPPHGSYDRGCGGFGLYPRTYEQLVRARHDKLKVALPELP